MRAVTSVSRAWAMRSRVSRSGWVWPRSQAETALQEAADREAELAAAYTEGVESNG